MFTFGLIAILFLLILINVRFYLQKLRSVCCNLIIKQVYAMKHLWFSIVLGMGYIRHEALNNVCIGVKISM